MSENFKKKQKVRRMNYVTPMQYTSSLPMEYVGQMEMTEEENKRIEEHITKMTKHLKSIGALK